MVNPSDSNDTPAPDQSSEINQEVKGDRNQAIGQIIGGTVISNLDGREIHIGDRVYQADPETVKRIVREELRVAHTEYSQLVGQGLNALANLMQISVVKNAVLTFRLDFQAACEQIDVIANYKALHDLLHTLEFQCYSVIVQESRRFPEDEQALDNLMAHELTLQNLLVDLQQVAARETISFGSIAVSRRLRNSS